MRGNLPRRLLSLASLGCMSLALVSCNTVRYEPIPETGASLTGTVSYKKEPVKIGLIIVAGPGGGATVDIGEDGRYTVQNAPLGDVTIAVNMAPAHGKIQGMKASGQKGPFPKVPSIPAKYSDPAKSPLKTTVNKGANTFDIVME